MCYFLDIINADMITIVENSSYLADLKAMDIKQSDIYLDKYDNISFERLVDL